MPGVAPNKPPLQLLGRRETRRAGRRALPSRERKRGRGHENNGRRPEGARQATRRRPFTRAGREGGSAGEGDATTLEGNYSTTGVIITFINKATSRRFCSLKPLLEDIGLFIVHYFKNVAPPFPLVVNSSRISNSLSKPINPLSDSIGSLQLSTCDQQGSPKDICNESRDSEDLQLIEVFPDLPREEQIKIINRIDRLKADLQQQHQLPPPIPSRPSVTSTKGSSLPHTKVSTSPLVSWTEMRYLAPNGIEVSQPTQVPRRSKRGDKLPITNVQKPVGPACVQDRKGHSFRGASKPAWKCPWFKWRSKKTTPESEARPEPPTDEAIPSPDLSILGSGNEGWLQNLLAQESLILPPPKPKPRKMPILEVCPLRSGSTPFAILPSCKPYCSFLVNSLNSSGMKDFCHAFPPPLERPGPGGRIPCPTTRTLQLKPLWAFL
ncbi:uncharacterized protein LOC133363683 [Rhineura floridana]|uniref:uncharacterized protein LOC133363683 n=1 Tax=Rhineura floridana TaxID=261503 RepID=UPI002AC853B7|nr:uncharacterized protein LOC133363683 [Rhineura floridana]